MSNDPDAWRRTCAAAYSHGYAEQLSGAAVRPGTLVQCVTCGHWEWREAEQAEGEAIDETGGVGQQDMTGEQHQSDLGYWQRITSEADARNSSNRVDETTAEDQKPHPTPATAAVDQTAEQLAYMQGYEAGLWAARAARQQRKHERRMIRERE